MLVCALSVQIARETAGAARTGVSLRPLISRAEDEIKPRAHRAAGMRNCVWNLESRHCEEHLRRSNPCFLRAERWVASRSLSSGAHSRDAVARNDGATSRKTSAARVAPAAADRHRPQTPADPRTVLPAPSAIPRTARSRRYSLRPGSRLRHDGCAE